MKRNFGNTYSVLAMLFLGLGLCACGEGNLSTNPITPVDGGGEKDGHLTEVGSDAAADVTEEDGHMTEVGSDTAADVTEEDGNLTEVGSDTAADVIEEDGHMTEVGSDTAADVIEEDSPITNACVVGGQGKLPLNYACNINGDCESNLCHLFSFDNDVSGGVCTKQCSLNANDTGCPGTMTCSDEGASALCRPRTNAAADPLIGPGDSSIPRYAPCWQNTDCKSGSCLGFSGTTAFCTAECPTDTSVCGDCGTCTDAGNSKKLCIPNSTGSVGKTCSYELDCSSRLCFMSGDSTHYCTDMCTPGQAGTCPDGYVCRSVNGSDSLCLLPTDIDTALGGSCEYNFQCASSKCLGFKQDAAYCSQACTLVPNKPQGSCTDGYSCVDFLGFGELYCVKAADTHSAFGLACKENWQCDTGICYEGFCNQTCAMPADVGTSKDKQCPTGTTCVLIDSDLRCVDSKTIDTRTPGEACAHDYECADGYHCKGYELDAVDTSITLYGSDGVTALKDGFDDNSGTSGFSKLSFTFAKAGSYYVKVDKGFGDYSLRVALPGTPVKAMTPVSETEPNNDAATANVFTVPFLAVASLGDSDSDWFKIVVAADNTTYVFETYYKEIPIRCEANPACTASQTIQSLPFATTGTLSGDSAYSLSSCASHELEGSDHMYAVSLKAGDRVFIRATTTSQANLALFVTLNCVRCVKYEDFTPNGGFENLVFTAPVSGTYKILVDTYDLTTDGVPFSLVVSSAVPAAECGSSFPPGRCCGSDTKLISCDAYGYLHNITCQDACGFDQGDITTNPGYFCVDPDAPTVDPTGTLPRECPNKL